MKFIKQIRQSLGWTQEALARRARVTQEVIARLERDSYNNPRILSVKKALSAMGYEFHIEAVPKKHAPLSRVEKSVFKELGQTGINIKVAPRQKKSFRAIL